MKSTMTKLMLVMASGAVVLGSALAGDLEPPGPPAPTMVTLQQIYNKGAVPKTGQAICWNSSGTPISCVGTGQDGAYQAGVSVGPRFTNNNDGTVNDNLTGLIWLRSANCFGSRNWTNALADANTLADPSCGLSDGSEAGDWRLPNLRELQSLIDYGNFQPVLPTGHPFTGVQSTNYWSSTTFVGNPANAWNVFLHNGGVEHFGKNIGAPVWPVRGGQ